MWVVVGWMIYFTGLMEWWVVTSDESDEMRASAISVLWKDRKCKTANSELLGSEARRVVCRFLARTGLICKPDEAVSNYLKDELNPEVREEGVPIFYHTGVTGSRAKLTNISGYHKYHSLLYVLHYCVLYCSRASFLFSSSHDLIMSSSLWSLLYVIIQDNIKKDLHINIISDILNPLLPSVFSSSSSSSSQTRSRCCLLTSRLHLHPSA